MTRQAFLGPSVRQQAAQSVRGYALISRERWSRDLVIDPLKEAILIRENLSIDRDDFDTMPLLLATQLPTLTRPWPHDWRLDD